MNPIIFERFKSRKKLFTERAALRTLEATFSDRFVVVAMLTTGSNKFKDEIMELSALLVEPTGVILSEFSSMVRIKSPLSRETAYLTGMTDGELWLKGQDIRSMMLQFLRFVGDHPLFLESATADLAFLQGAAGQARRHFNRTGFDVSDMVQAIWPEFCCRTPEELAQHLGLPEPTLEWRSLDIARAQLSFLLIGRMKLEKKLFRKPLAPFPCVRNQLC